MRIAYAAVLPLVVASAGISVVLLYHTGVPFAPGGYVGVGVFFVISGFLITIVAGIPGNAHPLALPRREEALLVTTLLPYAADVLVLLGVVMTIGVYGAIRMPDTYTKLHAMSKAMFLGVISFCASSLVTGDPAIICRVILISAILIVTTPISALAIARRLPAQGQDGRARRPRRVGEGLGQRP